MGERHENIFLYFKIATNMCKYRPLTIEDCKIGTKYQYHIGYAGGRAQWRDIEIINEAEVEKAKRRLPDQNMFVVRMIKSLDEIESLKGKTIILRRKMFIGDKPFHDVEVVVVSLKEKSVMCKLKTETIFVPISFFQEDRAEWLTPQGKPIIYLSSWYNY